ncbi:hypothetical protein JAO10_31820 [Burkholderia contaminans]|uniref:hypothetical protein n=1 Tax=Burkholderia cepacia complex TaxID=87882 RepID=UPI0013F172A0|nr:MULTISPECIES: hypothetical protein [Burkholderia cepacia complex]MBH9724925.1 hypothetical protein [Burkholderia contaminans]MBR8092866.1 hypothetical protein [Burkholderia cenocepacia]MBY4710816.1 hypothetical protein [Burkholderia cepacia]MBY4737002.1 hypothetical protein [Burkholderia cepacia]MBY4744340.1 hypothetical protein [Burkholderia cepacia]
MGRILGRVEYGANAKEPNRFFIHCDTSGWSMPPLFADPAEAWRVYDRDENGEALYAAVPKHSTIVRVIRKVLAHGHSFAASGEIYGEPLFGLATDDRLLYPLSRGFEENRRCFLKAGGVLHVAEEVDGGFSGYYDHPICAERWDWSKDDQRIAFEELFDQPLDLCPRCVEALLAKGGGYDG